ncbi:unnamed protein product [Urochloa humidicola]
MEIATGAITSLLPKLGYLLKEEYKLQKSVRGEIVFLRAELESMQAALLNISMAPIDQPPDIQVKLWAREVRELSYEIEDCVDTFMVRIDRAPSELQGLRRFIDRSINLLSKAQVRRKIGTDIKNIKSRIKEVSERRDRYKVHKVHASATGPTVDTLRLSALYRKARELVGIDEKCQTLASMLQLDNTRDSARQLKIVSVFGFGGLGKTTLAKIVYEECSKWFRCRAFVSISLNPNMAMILKNILHQFGNYKYEATWDEAQLINELRQFLRNKRYFVVIDDIWSKSVWETIKHAFIENGRGNIIITTTRILDVAKQAGDVYKLQPLSPLDSRKLFYLRISGTEDKCPPNELVQLSESILKKCAGVPLAIITIAAMLASKKGNESTYSYWSKVYRSMASGIENSADEVKDMRRILSISYHDLPPHLRSCLLCLCWYTEDFEIDNEKLIWKWVGEGLVRNEQGRATYDIGEDYLNELINRSMIQTSYIHGYCRVHDLVLDLITCLSNEENFLTTLESRSSMNLPNKIRRLSLRSCTEQDVKQLPLASMSHTRYLGLRSTGITQVPKEIGNLKFLQVLDLYGTGIDEVPSTIVELGELVCLCVESPLRIPDGFGNLSCLEEFQSFIIVESQTQLHDLDKLTKLRRARFWFNKWNKSFEKPFLKCISNMISIEYLRIDDCEGDLGSQCDRLSPGPQQLRNIDLRFSVITAVPRWISSLYALSTLRVRLLTLAEVDLQVLGSIPSLLFLDICVEELTQDRVKPLTIGDNDYPFLCLVELTMSKTMEVMFTQGAMKKLQVLELSFDVRKTMDQFCNFNFGLENLPSLLSMSVEMDCSNAKLEEVEAAEAAIRKALDMNPNKPVPCIYKTLEQAAEVQT